MTQLMPESLKHSVGHLRQNVHAIFDRWLRRRTGTEGNGTISTLVYGPPVDFEDKGDEVVVVAEIPNFDNEDVSIEVRDNRLILRGEKKQESEERGDNYYRTARNLTAFTRIIPLPPGVDAERANARFKNGVLRVVLPKTEQARTQQIEVHAS